MSDLRRWEPDEAAVRNAATEGREVIAYVTGDEVPEALAAGEVVFAFSDGRRLIRACVGSETIDTLALHEGVLSIRVDSADDVRLADGGSP